MGGRQAPGTRPAGKVEANADRTQRPRIAPRKGRSAAMANKSSLDPIISLAKRRGFVFQAGEIYGGSRSAWDYGPLGVEFKENIKRQWWQSMVRGRDDVVGLDSSVILPRQVWEASGHVEVFSDPLVESLHTHKRYRADHLLEAYEEKHGHPPVNGLADIKDPDTGQPGTGRSRRTSPACSRRSWARWTMKRACTTCGRKPPRASS